MRDARARQEWIEGKVGEERPIVVKSEVEEAAMGLLEWG